MSTSFSSHSRGRSLQHRPLPSIDKDVNNILPHPLPPSSSSFSNRDRTPSPVRRSPYIGSPSSAGSSPPPLSRSGSIYSHPQLSPSSLGDVKKLNRSSVSYLRNLSELTQNNSDDLIHGLGINETETEEVPGTAGRKRLARGESQKVYSGGKLWVDKQRQAIQTYEYLCHVGEAKQ
jgi:Ras GTPase-activating-like protein IQGAP2/3